MSKAVKAPVKKVAVKKRTSQGLQHRPLGKHARKNWKRYRGQGRP